MLNNTTTPTIHLQEKGWAEILEIVILVHISILTLFGNCMVIFAFIFGPRSIREFANYFVVNLAVSDLLVGCVSMPFWIVHTTAPQVLSNEVFYSLMTLDVLAGVTSILSLSAISVERMLAVKFPALHINMTTKPVIITIITTWVCGVTFSQTQHLITTKTTSVTSIKTYTGTVFVFGYMIPLLVILVSYCIIYYTAKNMIIANTDVKAAREIRLAKTISLVIGLFFVCWTPFFLVNMIYVFCDACFVKDQSKPMWPINLSKVFHFSNSMMNFFVYGVRSPDFRHFFRKVLCVCGFKRSRADTMLQKSRGMTMVSEMASDEHPGFDCGVTRPLATDSDL